MKIKQPIILCVSKRFLPIALNCVESIGASVIGNIGTTPLVDANELGLAHIDFEHDAVQSFWQQNTSQMALPRVFIMLEPADDQLDLPSAIDTFYSWHFDCVTFVHSKASQNSGARLAAGCVVLQNSSLQPLSDVGRGCLIMNDCYIGHHSTLESNVMIDSYAKVCSQVRIGKNTSIGQEAIIRDGISIGANCRIAPGAVITKSTNESTCYGPGLNNLLFSNL